MAYGATEQEARVKVCALALHVMKNPGKSWPQLRQQVKVGRVAAQFSRRPACEVDGLRQIKKGTFKDPSRATASLQFPPEAFVNIAPMQPW
jgi:hypothetical protein